MAERLYHCPARRRITAAVHPRYVSDLEECLARRDIASVFLTGGRSVRQFLRDRPGFFPGKRKTLEDGPLELYQFTLPAHREEEILQALAGAAGFDRPGHGSVFSQPLEEYCGSEEDRGSDEKAQKVDRVEEQRRLTRDLSLLTVILSLPGSGEHLAGIALELGLCVPIITHGIGTGVRDKLGLLRITIPPRKEIVHLLIPAHDEESILRILIDEARLNAPGRGFIYSTPVDRALLDTRLRLGKQRHAASIEQIIAAIDDLRQDTSWRRRSAAGARQTQPLYRREPGQEIIALCREGAGDRIVSRALRAGAGGATVGKVRRLRFSSPSGESQACERVILRMSQGRCEGVVAAILEGSPEGALESLQIISSPRVFSYQS
ncbi:hypothetical protein AU468_10035 [Alkalispirochaeta sphaeroplastigenens]|uniref:Uncharacterized protein n=1 Tax=Alkalispirochaeta sphaeroplastigenens TaxID=1187066 RepID=A0A2S4JJK5_9SPIO|nr:hypothetical protein [Alkalispirochaeta sphaeroplastigenens]POQ99640.1 hypothetical protein AU468_10035 [Alkalispirochaeta sphaeroplastigenens]